MSCHWWRVIGGFCAGWVLQVAEAAVVAELRAEIKADRRAKHWRRRRCTHPLCRAPEDPKHTEVHYQTHTRATRKKGVHAQVQGYRSFDSW